ncbi:MAG TPA: hypothetical protein PKD37_07025 [Oligoflexia bacterium]|nr:hypothetical protein [Oligoflexia bacterium]
MAYWMLLVAQKVWQYFCGKRYFYRSPPPQPAAVKPMAQKKVRKRGDSGLVKIILKENLTDS